MTSYIILAAISLVVVMIAINKRTNVSDSNDLKNEVGAELKKRHPLTPPEQALYWALSKVSSDLLVLPQVSFSAFLRTTGPDNKANFRLFNRVRQKVADFVICDKSFNVVKIIELDDSSHSAEKDVARDTLLAQAGIPVVRLNVKSSADRRRARPDTNTPVSLASL